MKRDELKKILPHREPMLLIDEAEKIDDTTATGRYTVTGDEFFFTGTFSRQSGRARRYPLRNYGPDLLRLNGRT